MTKKFTHLVFIGRFQPLHNGHIHIIKEALGVAEKLIILVGSANAARSPRNPFTYSERLGMIKRVVAECGAEGRAIIQPLHDVPYNDSAWIAGAQRAVSDAILGTMNPSPHITLSGLNDAVVGLIGYSKDRSNFYLKLFPEWEAVAVKTQYGTLSATDIRADYLRRSPIIPGKHIVDKATREFLEAFTLRDEFKWLVNEAEFYTAYKKAWEGTPYPVFINCVDAVVVQSGHILLIERGERPGKGLLALPGGHVNVNETFREAAVRELKEESRISDSKGEIPPAMLASFIEDRETRLFDNPDRSQRGRVVTQAYKFTLPNATELFGVRGDDDAASARWHELGTLSSHELYEDHAAIIEEMTGAKLS